MVKVLFPKSSTECPTVDGADVVRFDPRQPIPEEHRDAEVLVVWEMSPRMVRQAVEALPNLKFAQLLTSGVDLVPQMGFGEDVVVAGGRSLHDRTVAEHALALMLAGVRGLNTLVRAQIGHRWAREWDAARQADGDNRLVTLDGANILIWGYGSIGSTLAGLLKPLGANVVGVATSRRTEDGVEVYETSDLPTLLETTDVLVMILPAGKATEGVLDAETLRLLPRHAWLVNVGRGATVDEAALEGALRKGEIAGAAVDVTRVEPLPVESPLWDLPNFILTPHNAGGRPKGHGELLSKNIAAWQAGSPLINQVTGPRED